MASKRRQSLRVAAKPKIKLSKRQPAPPLSSDWTFLEALPLAEVQERFKAVQGRLAVLKGGAKYSGVTVVEATRLRSLDARARVELLDQGHGEIRALRQELRRRLTLRT